MYTYKRFDYVSRTDFTFEYEYVQRDLFQITNTARQWSFNNNSLSSCLICSSTVQYVLLNRTETDSEVPELISKTTF